MDPFDADMFGDSVTVFPIAPGSEQRGDPAALYPGAGVTLAASVEITAGDVFRREGHNMPEGEQGVRVFTATDPGAGVDWRFTWQGRELTALAGSTPQGGGAVWYTPCLLVR